MGKGELWRIDPTGQFWNCHAAVVGRQSDRVEEALVTTLLERIQETKAQDSQVVTDMGTFLQSITCDEALSMICGCLQSVFWPKSINLRGLPEGVKAAIPSIPWVAVTLQEDSKSIPIRRIRRGAFLPPIVNDEDDEETTGSKDE